MIFLKSKLLLPGALLAAVPAVGTSLSNGGSLNLGSFFQNSGTVTGTVKSIDYELGTKEGISVDSLASGVQVKDMNSQPTDISLFQDSISVFQDSLLKALDDGRSRETTEGLLFEMNKESVAIGIDSNIKQKIFTTS